MDSTRPEVRRHVNWLLMRRRFRDCDIALVQRYGIFAPIKLHSNGGRSVPAQDDTTLVSKPGAALLS